MSFDAETASSETVIIHVGEALEAVLILTEPIQCDTEQSGPHHGLAGVSIPF
ncbi:hypothetical protein GGQ21_003171, partial [Salinibacter ruber]|nr:hypothetical protein [Salinibacter ruber]